MTISYKSDVNICIYISCTIFQMKFVNKKRELVFLARTADKKRKLSEKDKKIIKHDESDKK